MTKKGADMIIDPNQFIIQATNLLHSSLDPAVSVKKFFDYCCTLVPLKALSLYSSPQKKVYTLEMAYVTPSFVSVPMWDATAITPCSRTVL